MRMTFKQQWNTIKQNWLIALVLLVMVLVPLFSGTTSSGIMKAGGFGVEEMALAMDSRSISYYPSGDFAPEVVERKITKSASLSSEIERGEFKDAETRLRAIVIATDSYLLNENVYKSGRDRNSYFTGTYQIKVSAEKYDAVISQLKAIGEVESFSENARDITARHTDLTTELEAERGRLQRYKDMLEDAEDINDKIQLTDKIYNLERTISYLEDALQNVDRKVEYSTVHVTLREEPSGYANVVLVKFSELIEGLVNSFNALISLIFWALPWAILALVVWVVVRVVKRR